MNIRHVKFGELMEQRAQALDVDFDAGVLGLGDNACPLVRGPQKLPRIDG
jgi:hypothetical protein